ncbi:MAG: ChaN family lipoprotein [Elusimicrobia bacterium]|nr:ChaN family lipoprotein [Elusimicrobiota bacterium]
MDLPSAVLAAALLLAPAGKRGPAGPAAPSSGPGACVLAGATGQPAPPQAVAEAIARSRAVSVGETHDQANDHLAQLEVLKALAASHGDKVAVGFEMLNESLQGVLDDYAAGRLSEAEFLAKADWQKEWGFPFALYKPLFDLIREHRLKALALNAPRGLVTKTARVGLEGLTPEERALLPKDMALSQDPRYMEFLKAAFGGHGAAAKEFRLLAMPGVTWEHYLQAMMIWNEVMAANASAYLNADSGSALLVVAGNGHVMYGAGIPFGIGRRAPGALQTTFYTEGSSECPASLPEGLSGMADFVWFVPHAASR